MIIRRQLSSGLSIYNLRSECIGAQIRSLINLLYLARPVLTKNHLTRQNQQPVDLKYAVQDWDL